MSSWSQKEIRLDSIIDYSKENMKSSLGSGFIEFVNDFYKNASPEDLSLRLDELYAIVLSNWKFISAFNQTGSKIRIFNPTLEEHGWTSSHTIIQILSKDMPFLIDSITSNLLEDGNALHMLIHPVLEFNRNDKGKMVEKGGKKSTESIMHIEITAMSDEQEIGHLHEKLKTVTDFVHASVEDWKSIVKKVEETSKNLDLAPKSVTRAEVKEGQAFLKWLTENNFTLLGYREYDHNNKKSPHIGDGYGILRDPVLSASSHRTAITSVPKTFPISTEKFVPWLNVLGLIITATMARPFSTSSKPCPVMSCFKSKKSLSFKPLLAYCI